LSPLTALIPAAASAATSLAKSAAHGIAEGVSFAAELAKGNREANAAEAREPAAALPAELQAAIDRFAELIRQKLAGAGIDLADPVSLTGDGLGGIDVGDHPQAAAIESLLANDEEAANAFHQLAARFHAAMVGPDPAMSSLSWDQSSAGRDVSIEVAANAARASIS
jgi:hypothetical protein